MNNSQIQNTVSQTVNIQCIIKKKKVPYLTLFRVIYSYVNVLNMKLNTNCYTLTSFFFLFFPLRCPRSNLFSHPPSSSLEFIKPLTSLFPPGETNRIFVLPFVASLTAMSISRLTLFQLFKLSLIIANLKFRFFYLTVCNIDVMRSGVKRVIRWRGRLWRDQQGPLIVTCIGLLSGIWFWVFKSIARSRYNTRSNNESRERQVSVKQSLNINSNPTRLLAGKSVRHDEQR